MTQGITTTLLHTKPNIEDPHGALHYPIYQNVAFEFDSAESIEDAFKGRKPRHSYSRITNPTVEHLEKKIRIITDSVSVTAVSSGMAAISTFFLTILKSGDNIVASNRLFGNTLSLFESTFKPFNITVKLVDFTKPEHVEKAIDHNTRALFFETITNPQTEVANIEAIAKIAKQYSVILAADTTATPPNIFNAKQNGVDIELISGTKFISGGATTVGGFVIDNGTFDWSKNPRLVEHHAKFGQMAFTAKYKKEVYRNSGVSLSPQNAYMQLLGLETLVLRVDQAVKNANTVAQWLENNKHVTKVNYPGLKSSPFYDIAQKQFNGKPGAILSFEVESKEIAFKLINNLKIVKRATNLNDNKTLIIHPASTIYSEFTDEKRYEYGISEGLIRLSVGIEDVQDIINDLDEALQC